jgi:sigma-B regulation protein RsbU (phosphoserine phosphatase)
MCVADVCGKGLQAALVTASLHTLIHTNITTKLDLADLINRLNHYLCQMLPDSSFVTGIVALLNPATGQLEFINAGHPPILVMDAQGQIRELEAGLNPPLGFIPDPMEMSRDTLAPGQLMMLYTDGLSEMLHHDTNEMLGIKGVGQLLSQAYASGSAVDQIMQNFDAELMRYQGSVLPQDDKAYLLAKRS